MTHPPLPLHKARRRGLNRLKGLRNILVETRRFVCNRIWGMDIHPTAQFSLSAKFDCTFPPGVHVGAQSCAACEARILTHDVTRGLYLHAQIGTNCFIGGRSLILPGWRSVMDQLSGPGRWSQNPCLQAVWLPATRPASCVK
jgi:acetyltransferase-like isoleucine patch superfamily enzyme